VPTHPAPAEPGPPAPLAPSGTAAASTAPARPAPSAPSAPAPGHAPAGGPPAPPRLSAIAPTTVDPAAQTPVDLGEPPAVDPGKAPAVDPGEPPAVDAEPARLATPADERPPQAGDLGPVTAMWPAVLDALKDASRVAYTLADGTRPVSRSSSGIVVAHPDKSRLDYLRNNKGHLELLRLAVLDVLHLDGDIDFVLDPERASAVPAAPPAAAQVVAPATGGPSPRERAASVVAEERAVTVEPHDDVVSDDDDDADGELSGLALVQRELGGTVMTEYDNG